MSSFFKMLTGWFGYSRRERRSSLILLFLMVLVAILRYAIPEKRINVSEMSGLMLPEVTLSENAGKSGNALAVNILTKQGKVETKRGYTQIKSKKLELNRCDSADLERLPGLGPVLSSRIVKFRNLLGGFAEVSQLREVYGLPDSTYNIICTRFTVDTALIRRIKINSATFAELNRHPYIERFEVQAIIKYRESIGRIDGISRLVSENILTGEKARRLLPYLSFE